MLVMVMIIIYFYQLVVVGDDRCSAAAMRFRTNPATFRISTDVTTVSMESVCIKLKNWSPLLGYSETENVLGI